MPGLRTGSTAWIVALLAPAGLLALASCSGTPPQTSDSGDGSTGGKTGSGGSQQGSGGVEQGAGGEVGSGGTSSTGGRDGLMANQCTDAHGCAVGASCSAPGAPPPTICGAPQWCGACACPMMPPIPAGSGSTCAESAPCPSVTDTTPRAASLCDPETSLCTECLSDEDCTGGLRYCALGGPAAESVCYQCQSDDDCSDPSPYCTSVAGDFGTCRQCKTTADCAAGVCTIDGICTPGCQSDAVCGPNRVCGAEERCVPQPCQNDGECSEQSSCSEQTCVAHSCTSDAACPGGYCVSGSCFEDPGTCHFDTTG